MIPRPRSHRSGRGAAGEAPDDRGAAIVEYTLVAALLVFLFLGVAQVALVLHARNVLVEDAAEGARTAATRGASMNDGEQACARAIKESLSSAVTAGSRLCHGESLAASGAMPALVRMDVSATLPMTFIPLGKVHLDVAARAIQEPR